MQTNSIIDRLPSHLMAYVIDQPYNEYTPQNQAVWRYVMKKNIHYLPHTAHHAYLEGLRKTGISVDSIPHMYGMNRILKEIGWAAVAVDGFIPPQAFMEFQAHNVLVIAADIRPIDQIGYTPAPDIIHEAAGHAPIIAVSEYAEYLKNFGAIGSKAFSSAHDYKLYEAIRHLSILKANPNSPAHQIQSAEKQLADAEKNINQLSEMARLRNLHWWTVEYGLIGALDNPKIYGAGLLSSIAESKTAFNPNVRKIPYTIDAQFQSFDITKPQPQLFVTPSFEYLHFVLNQFAQSMALNIGGLYGINQAIDSQNLATCVYKSGLQVSGIFTEVITNQNNRPVYIRTSGPTQLSVNDKQLPKHGKKYHANGFGSPIGNLKDTNKDVETFMTTDLKRFALDKNDHYRLVFDSGVVVEGELMNIIYNKHYMALLSFRDCKVTYNGTILFLPEWGIYDMALGSEIVSAFSGVADPEAFEYRIDAPQEKTIKIKYTEDDKKLHQVYQTVREFRQNGCQLHQLTNLWQQTKQNFPDEWLIFVEIQELIDRNNFNGELLKGNSEHLTELTSKSEAFEKLITESKAFMRIENEHGLL